MSTEHRPDNARSEIERLTAEVKHWKDHAEEAGEGFSRVCKDAARTGARRRELVRQIQALVESPEATQYRDEACRHVVNQPYADNRYVRLLDAIREVVRDA
jgi:hypothetical protein